jgi:hypothetical protein
MRLLVAGMAALGLLSGCPWRTPGPGAPPGPGPADPTVVPPAGDPGSSPSRSEVGAGPSSAPPTRR